MSEPQMQNNVKMTSAFWLCFALLFLAVIAFHAKTVPFSNEFAYLLRLQQDFLPNDWTFSSPAHEHWFFNLIFSLPSRVLSLQMAAWFCRVAGWLALLIGLIRLGKRWEIAYWKIGISVFVWLAFAQTVVNEEWMFGGFEAKVVAYICILFSLIGFTRRRIIWPSILLGLSFSFHPAVGLWAILAVGFAFLLERLPLKDFVRVITITGVFTLIGVIPLLLDQSAAGSFDDWKFVVLYRAPSIMDALKFSKSGMILCFVMLAFNCIALWRDGNFGLRFLLKFQIALSLFFIVGVALRWFEMYSLLQIMPMRLFPVFTSLFFLWTAFYQFQRQTSREYKIVIALFAVLVVAFIDPIGKGYMQIRETSRSWTAGPDDFRQASVWIAGNTRPDSLIIQPPNRTEFWYFANRRGVVSFGYPTYDRLPEWRSRLSDLTGGHVIQKGETAGEEIENAFNQLTPDQVDGLKTRYDASYLVSCGVYPYPIVFRTETYKVYQLP